MVQLPGAGGDDLVRTLVVASRALVAVAARSLAEVEDVTLLQFRALVVVGRQGVTVSDLAAALDLHPTTTTRLTDRLVRKDLVRRADVAEDRRVTLLQLTPAGARLVRRVTERRTKDLADIVARIPEEQWSACNRALAVFTAAAGEPDAVDLLAWDLPDA